MGEVAFTPATTQRVSAQHTDRTLFVVDDDAEIRRLVRTMAQSVGLVVEDYASAAKFLERYDPGRAGCLVLDIRMPGMNGIELQTKLGPPPCGPPIIFVTGQADIPLAIQAIRNGAVDFIQKPFSFQALLEQIHKAMAFDCEGGRRRSLKRDVERRISKLTDRERQIMRMLAAGESSKSIALELSISFKTVGNYQTGILEKMGVDNPTQLANLLAMLDERSMARPVPN